MKSKIIIVFLCLFVLACSESGPMYIGKQYLDVKYVNDPLGEEIAPDTDPLIRFDAFDCMTFVETALANGDKDRLTKIRYKNGEVGFLTRNHFVETDWMKNNSDILENATRKYSEHVAVRNVTIDKKLWFKRVHNIDVDIPKQNVKIEYVPRDYIKDLNIIKPVVVLFIIDNPKIRDNIGTDLAVSHMGFLLPGGVLRHASSQFGRVIDVDFQEYIDEHNKNNLGISILEIK